MDTPVGTPQMELEAYFPLPPNKVEKIQRPGMAYRAHSYNGYESSSSLSSSSAPSLRSSIRSSASSTRSIKSVRFHETRNYIVDPESELSWADSTPEIQVTPATPVKRGRPQLARSNWSMPSTGSKLEDSVGQSIPAATGSAGSETDFEAWLAKTAIMGRVEGFGSDERRPNPKASQASRRQSPQTSKAQTKKSRRQSWLCRLSGV